MEWAKNEKVEGGLYGVGTILTKHWVVLLSFVKCPKSDIWLPLKSLSTNSPFIFMNRMYICKVIHMLTKLSSKSKNKRAYNIGKNWIFVKKHTTWQNRPGIGVKFQDRSLLVEGIFWSIWLNPTAVNPLAESRNFELRPLCMVDAQISEIFQLIHKNHQ